MYGFIPILLLFSSNTTAQQLDSDAATINSTSLVEINSADYGDTNCLMKIVELERNANTSKLKLTYRKLGGCSVGGSMFIMSAFYEVAKARGMEYFTNLKEWDDPEGGRLYIGGFTNTKDADIQKEFGHEFARTNDSGQSRGYISVSMLKQLEDLSYLAEKYIDDPANFAIMPISTRYIHGCKTYHNEEYGFEIKYPDNYFLVPSSSSERISLRENTSSAEECKTQGKRIGVYVYRLGKTPRGEICGIGLGGYFIKLTKESTLDDIAHQFLVDGNRPLVRRNCYQRVINGNFILICTLLAPGESPERTGGIFNVFVLGIYEMKNGERILVKVCNDDGGTPYTVDRALRHDVLQVFHTLRWK